MVLRGGTDTGPNYGPEAIRGARELLAGAGLPEVLMVDCSHGNSEKDPERQARVVESIIEQRRNGETAIRGLMIESHLEHGHQDPASSPLRYGQSITDACLSFEATEPLLRALAESVSRSAQASVAGGVQRD